MRVLLGISDPGEEIVKECIKNNIDISLAVSEQVQKVHKYLLAFNEIMKDNFNDMSKRHIILFCRLILKLMLIYVKMYICLIRRKKNARFCGTFSNSSRILKKA